MENNTEDSGQLQQDKDDYHAERYESQREAEYTNG